MEAEEVRFMWLMVFFDLPVKTKPQRGRASPEVVDFDSPTGKGALGTVEGKRVLLGIANALRLDRQSL